MPLIQPGQPPGEHWNISDTAERSALGKNKFFFPSKSQAPPSKSPWIGSSQKRCAIGQTCSLQWTQTLKEQMDLVASPALDLDPSGTSPRLPLQCPVNASQL